MCYENSLELYLLRYLLFTMHFGKSYLKVLLIYCVGLMATAIIMPNSLKVISIASMPINLHTDTDTIQFYK